MPLRLFILNLASDPDEGEELVFINPVIERPKGNAEKEEGCLSMPGVNGFVKRPDTIHVQAYDLSGNLFDATGNFGFMHARNPQRGGPLLNNRHPRVIDHTPLPQAAAAPSPSRGREEKEPAEEKFYEIEAEILAGRGGGPVAGQRRGVRIAGPFSGMAIVCSLGV